MSAVPMENAVSFENVDVIFGPSPAAAIRMLDQGAGRDEIFAKTRNVVAVHGASLSVAPGEICVLMGLSGSGKSSLLRCVNALNKVARGSVRIGDNGASINVANCDQQTLYRLRTERISMVFQHFALMPWRSIRENVAFGLELSGLSKAQRRRVVDEKLEMVRLAEWGDKYPHELSGGMQQRVGLARALATDAGILLMDEPFSALDPLIREHLQDELLQIQSELQKTIIFVSHDLDEALKLGSRIAIMESGRIVQSGGPEEIISQPADDYVRQFVASMNPLKVLSCASLMRPLARLVSTNGRRGPLLMDAEGRYRCRLSEEGRIEEVTGRDGLIPLAAFAEDLDLRALPTPTMVSARPETPMRAAVEINHETGVPVPILDGEGRLVGVVGAAEIFCGILRDCDPAAE